MPLVTDPKARAELERQFREHYTRTNVKSPGECPEMPAQTACRLSARAMIEDKIHRLRAQADGLEALSKALPLELTREADEALWQLLCNVRF